MRIQKRYFDLPLCLSGAALACVCIILQPGLSSRANASVFANASEHTHIASGSKHLLIRELSSIAFAVSHWQDLEKKVMPSPSSRARLQASLQRNQGHIPAAQSSVSARANTVAGDRAVSIEGKQNQKAIRTIKAVKPQGNIKSGSGANNKKSPIVGRAADDPVMADEAAFLVESALQDFIVNVGDRVFFETDSAVLTSHAVAIIRSQVSWLQKNPDITVTVEGHADELGSKEYNIELGVRRAKAVKTVLVKAGVAPERVRILSFGKERPVALCKNPPCGAQNRRVITRLNGRLNSQLGETILPGNKPDLFEKGVPNTQDFPSSLPQNNDEKTNVGGEKNKNK